MISVQCEDLPTCIWSLYCKKTSLPVYDLCTVRRLPYLYMISVLCENLPTYTISVLFEDLLPVYDLCTVWRPPTCIWSLYCKKTSLPVYDLCTVSGPRTPWSGSSASPLVFCGKPRSCHGRSRAAWCVGAGCRWQRSWGTAGHETLPRLSWANPERKWNRAEWSSWWNTILKSDSPSFQTNFSKKFLPHIATSMSHWLKPPSLKIVLGQSWREKEQSRVELLVENHPEEQLPLFSDHFF